MPAAAVVEAVDVVKERLRDLSTRRPSVAPNEFGLQGFEKGLDGSIIITVSLAAHRYFKTQLLQSLLIIVGAILGRFKRS